MWRKSSFQVLENPSIQGTVFAWSFHLLFIFIFQTRKIKNKNPLMTPVRKKQSTKLDFWVRGSGYLLEKYLIQGSTPLGSRSGLYQWIGYIGAYGSKIGQFPQVTQTTRLMQSQLVFDTHKKLITRTKLCTRGPQLCAARKGQSISTSTQYMQIPNLLKFPTMTKPYIFNLYAIPIGRQGQP